jgi:hypothetical protein
MGLWDLDRELNRIPTPRVEAFGARRSPGGAARRRFAKRTGEAVFQSFFLAGSEGQRDIAGIAGRFDLMIAPVTTGSVEQDYRDLAKLGIRGKARRRGGAH